MSQHTRISVEMLGAMTKPLDQPLEEVGDWYKSFALGVPIYVRKDDKSVTPCIVKDGYWEPWITAWFLNQLDKDTTVIDIGANTGYYSLLAAPRVREVMAYEPNPQYAEMIRASIKIGWEYTRDNLNLLPLHHFNVYELAVADQVGNAVLQVPRELHGSATIRDYDLSEYDATDIKCRQVSLDYHTAGLILDKLLIKVDAEGAEELIWKGAQVTNYRHKPVWMIEYTPGAYGRDFLSNLEQYGDLMWINYDGQEQPISKSEILAHTDWVMLVIRPR